MLLCSQKTEKEILVVADCVVDQKFFVDHEKVFQQQSFSFFVPTVEKVEWAGSHFFC